MEQQKQRADVKNEQHSSSDDEDDFEQLPAATNAVLQDLEALISHDLEMYSFTAVYLLRRGLQDLAACGDVFNVLTNFHTNEQKQRLEYLKLLAGCRTRAELGRKFKLKDDDPHEQKEIKTRLVRKLASEDRPWFDKLRKAFLEPKRSHPVQILKNWYFSLETRLRRVLKELAKLETQIESRRDTIRRLEKRFYLPEKYLKTPEKNEKVMLLQKTSLIEGKRKSFWQEMQASENAENEDNFTPEALLFRPYVTNYFQVVEERQRVRLIVGEQAMDTTTVLPVLPPTPKMLPLVCRKKFPSEVKRDRSSKTIKEVKDAAQVVVPVITIHADGSYDQTEPKDLEKSPRKIEPRAQPMDPSEASSAPVDTSDDSTNCSENLATTSDQRVESSEHLETSPEGPASPDDTLYVTVFQKNTNTSSQDLAQNSTDPPGMNNSQEDPIKTIPENFIFPEPPTNPPNKLEKSSQTLSISLESSTTRRGNFVDFLEENASTTRSRSADELINATGRPIPLSADLNAFPADPHTSTEVGTPARTERREKRQLSQSCPF